MVVPQRSEVVIIGGGVIGASIAYHLAERGKTDVTLVERKSLTSGSTWHAAGLVGQLRSSSSLTQLMRKSVATYQALEEKTGYATGWRAAYYLWRQHGREHEVAHEHRVAPLAKVAAPDDRTE
jgi:glycine/D-amino acid oxidase-like deaminating enzyme